MEMEMEMGDVAYGVSFVSYSHDGTVSCRGGDGKLIRHCIRVGDQ